MKIYQRDTDRVARKFAYRDGSAPKYRLFPANREREPNGTRHLNTIQQEIAFSDVRHAAEFLMRHEGTAIRMDPGGVILSRNIVVDCDGDEPIEAAFLEDAEPGETT